MEQAKESLAGEAGNLLANSTVLILGALAILIYALSWCRIFTKAGHHGALGLLMLIPGVNLVMQMTLAFGRWPVEREVRELRGVRKAIHQADQKTLRRAA